VTERERETAIANNYTVSVHRGEHVDKQRRKQNFSIENREKMINFFLFSFACNE